MARDLVRHVDILEPRNVLHGSQSGDGVQPATRGAEQVVQHPVVPSISVDKSAGHDGTHLQPSSQRGGHGCPEQEDVLNNTVGAFLREFKERVEDHPGAQGEPDEGDGAHSQVPLQQNVCQNAACRLSPIECV